MEITWKQESIWLVGYKDSEVIGAIRGNLDEQYIWKAHSRVDENGDTICIEGIADSLEEAKNEIIKNIG